MNDRLFETLTFVAVGVPAVLFALWKAWLALLMVRGTRIQTEIGRWLVRMYTVSAALTFIIGIAYLLTVSDRQGWVEHNFLAIRQIMRITIGALYLAGSVAAFKLWRNVQELEDRNLDRDAIRDQQRDAQRDHERDLDRDLGRDSGRDATRDALADLTTTERDENGKDTAS